MPIRSFARLSLLGLSSFLLGLHFHATAQNPSWYPGQDLYWERAQSPYTPRPGAIAGGPGNDPSPGSPMFICRARYAGSMQPGKWVRGSCNITYGGQEIMRSSFEVAYGNASWLPYNGNPTGLVQTGTDTDGTPLYSCRFRFSGGSPNTPPIPGIPFGSDLGYQPGKLLDGSCHIPLGGQEVVQQPPFQALYSAGYYPPYNPPPSQPSAPAVPYAQPGPSSVSWQSARAPFTPGAGAIEGGPGNGPKPGSPLYICRSGYNGSLIPGKWIQGECSVAYQGREYKFKKYDVAYGIAKWVPFGGISADMVQGGYDSDGTPLYICRVPHLKPAFHDVGTQPGKLVGGTCRVPYANVEISQDPPFEVLVSVLGSASAAQPPPTVSDQRSGGLEVVFQTGTGAAPGNISIKNGATGAMANKDLPPNLSADACAAILVQAAFQAGLQIQSESSGSGLKIFGSNNSINVTGASVLVSQF